MIYFTEKEMACRCCGKINLAPGFDIALDGLRGEYTHPLKVLSGCRCPKHNKAEKGHKNSLHLTDNPRWSTQTCAVDVIRPGFIRLGVLVRLAQQRQFSVGIAPGFIHLDWRTATTGRKPGIFTY